MVITEIVNLIKIGFDQPKFYKRSVWNKAVKVMEFLSDNTEGQVYRYDYGKGKAKYSTNIYLTERQLNIWANLYNNKLEKQIVTHI